MIERTFLPKQFEWDEKNINKNWRKHRVAFTECEEVFFNESLIVAEINRSRIIYNEERRIAYGITNSERLLFIVFTIRGKKIRVISARDMHKNERSFYYEESKKANTI